MTRISRLHVPFDPALEAPLIAAFPAEAVAVLADDLREGSFARVDGDDWAAERAAGDEERARAYAASLAAVQAAARRGPVVVWARPVAHERDLLGLVASLVPATGPADVSVVWRTDDEDGSPLEQIARAVPLDRDALAEYAFSFQGHVARRVGERLGGASEKVPQRIETERLILRRPEPGDGPELFRAVSESRARLLPFMPWVHEHASAEASELSSRRAHLDFLARRDLPYRGLLKEDEATLVLSTGLHRIDWPAPGQPVGPRVEIGYWVRTGWEGKGLATEAAQAMAELALGVLQARRIEVRCAAGNEPSRRVAERIGFPLEARLAKAQRLPSGDVDDELIFAHVPLRRSR